ncbi:MAG: hypothetical protein AAF841_14010 [Pseudomonadota bacterium]
MRIFLFCLIASPLHAWDFSPGAPCLLSDEQDGLKIELTHDPVAPLYSITLTRQVPWPQAPVFSIAFSQGPTISTNRHTLSGDGLSLTVEDRGFGNVIAGMVAGGSAQARLGNVTESFSLRDAAEPALDFNACAPSASA